MYWKNKYKNTAQKYATRKLEDRKLQRCRFFKIMRSILIDLNRNQEKNPSNRTLVVEKLKIENTIQIIVLFVLVEIQLKIYMIFFKYENLLSQMTLNNTHFEILRRIPTKQILICQFFNNRFLTACDRIEIQKNNLKIDFSNPI